jgi:hypothetical protein
VCLRTMVVQGLTPLACPFNPEGNVCMEPILRSSSRRSAILVLLPYLLAGCSTPYSTPPPPAPPVTYTIGGTVVNLAGTNLVLQDNGGDNLTLNANGNFTFPKSIASGGAFVVTVLTEPSAPAQTCGVVNGSGAATANVTNVIVNCGGHGEWAWMSGAQVGQPECCLWQ